MMGNVIKDLLLKNTLVADRLMPEFFLTFKENQAIEKVGMFLIHLMK